MPDIPIGSDVYGLIEKKLGYRVAQSVLVLAIMAAVVAFSSIILSPLKPFLPFLLGAAVSTQRWSSYLQFAGAIFALGIIAIFATRVQGRLAANDRQLIALQKHTKITEVILEDLSPMQDEIDRLTGRVSRLETHTDISGLRKLILERMMAEHASQQERLELALKGLQDDPADVAPTPRER